MMKANYSRASSSSAMEYLKQIRALTAFSSLFDFKSDAVKVDNIIFRLHSMVTVYILMVGTMFVTMRQYFGDPIECMGGKSDITPALLQHYCWLESTFSVTSPSSSTDSAYPGVKPLISSQGEKKNYHKYYQWVYFVLMLQAIMFYVPKYLWKAKEAKRLRALITELRIRHIKEMSEYDRLRLAQDLADTLLISNEYFYFFIFCEIIYFIHLIFQIWFTNLFLGGYFFSLGIEWMAYSHMEEDNRHDPLVRTFPRLTKCSFHKYGYSGTIEVHDVLCFLPLNIVNEKIYVILWFWFLFLLIMTGLYLVYRLLLIVCPRLRLWRLRAIAPSTDTKFLERLTSRCGNWFILNFVANNMKPSHFRDLIDEVMKQHFDTNGKPIYISAISKMYNGVQAAQNAAQNSQPAATKHSKHKSSHKKGIEVGFTNPPLPGFTVGTTRDPPYGQSVDWPSAYNNIMNAGNQMNTGSSEPLHENWD
ncbi:innexin inx2-like [Panonychus citri]|uniref:innexin inx2-like n=1 Tax=Panonychus citri TaxID=50023 RepID=UPI0023078404|nr:innexin inx2-like [Panonychus citri]